ncbi:hypothetical protein [Paenibacillus elgii]|uniref:hypothetical protein n=1 Tax=Paenibacillus elgii TaxID=189691 RepID=UPI00203C1317|nr:hypothetical protein [Paenibacillus elgii]MCM3272125.1 hypothetical protein [Paenibacillus elgii]
MWIVTTDEFDSTTQVFETEEEAKAAYDEFVTEREYAGDNYRVFLAEVKQMSDSPEPWRMEDL